MSAIIAANRWFDRLEEPWRFLAFMGGIHLPLALVMLAAPTTYIVLALALIGMRVWWLKIGSRR